MFRKEIAKRWVVQNERGLEERTVRRDESCCSADDAHVFQGMEARANSPRRALEPSNVVPGEPFPRGTRTSEYRKWPILLEVAF